MCFSYHQAPPPSLSQFLFYQRQVFKHHTNMLLFVPPLNIKETLSWPLLFSSFLPPFTVKCARENHFSSFPAIFFFFLIKLTRPRPLPTHSQKLLEGYHRSWGIGSHLLFQQLECGGRKIIILRKVGLYSKIDSVTNNKNLPVIMSSLLNIRSILNLTLSRSKVTSSFTRLLGLYTPLFSTFFMVVPS